jgi:CRP/FNR family transcriptional regulator, anaerobic regulatory protein
VRLKKGGVLYRAGDSFTALYAIRMGSCKTTVLAEDGREQVAGYHVLGDVIAMDGIGTERHGCQAVALEDTEYCVLPFDELGDLARSVAPLQRNLCQFLSREIARGHSVMLLLGSMRAEERLAAFLLNLSQRYRERGYSSTEFVLRMTREEIGSYLGLKLETIRRLFPRFHREGLIQVLGAPSNCSTSRRSSSSSRSAAGPCRAAAHARVANDAEREHHAAAAKIADQVERRHRRFAGAADARKRTDDRDVVDVVSGSLRERAVLSPVTRP